MGFEADIHSKQDIKDMNVLSHLSPDDLIRYGLIPEFVGRLPVPAVLEDLDRDALIRILTEPKNALVKQYEKIFSFEDVELEFKKDSLEEVADIAVSREAGARGLRAVLEKVMMALMYDIPSRENIEKVIVTRKTIQGKEEAEIIFREEEKSA